MRWNPVLYVASISIISTERRRWNSSTIYSQLYKRTIQDEMPLVRNSYHNSYLSTQAGDNVGRNSRGVFTPPTSVTGKGTNEHIVSESGCVEAKRERPAPQERQVLLLNHVSRVSVKPKWWYWCSHHWEKGGYTWSAQTIWQDIAKSFSGPYLIFCNWFLEKRVMVAVKLYRLLEDNMLWKWQSKHQAAFEALKEIICTSTILVHYEMNQFVLSVDLSP